MVTEEAARLLTELDHADPATLRRALALALHGLEAVHASSDPSACAAQAMEGIGAVFGPSAPAVGCRVTPARGSTPPDVDPGRARSLEDRFDELMGALDSPMVVVTTASGDERAGCLVGFHAQCGMQPPAYAVWLSKANRTYRVGALAEMFAVHFLSEANIDLARLFGTTTGDDIDKFAQVSWHPGPSGVPLLDDCPSRIVGRRRAFVDVDTDHACVMLDPIMVDGSGPSAWLGLAEVIGLDPGHQASGRQPAD